MCHRNQSTLKYDGALKLEWMLSFRTSFYYQLRCQERISGYLSSRCDIEVC